MPGIAERYGLKPVGGIAGKYGLKPVEDQVVQEEHPALGGRRYLAQLARDFGEDAAVRYLEQEGFEAGMTGEGQLKVRQPGEREWRVLDPKFGHGGVGEFFKDIGPDILPDVASLAGYTLGAVGGAAVGTAAGGPVGGFLGGIAGSGGGGAGIQAQKAALAKTLGIPITLGEAGKSVGREAVVGAASEFGGQVIAGGLRLGGKALQVPLKLERHITRAPEREALDLARQAERASIADTGAATERLGEARQALRPLREGAEEASEAADRTLAELTQAKMRYRQELDAASAKAFDDMQKLKVDIGAPVAPTGALREGVKKTTQAAESGIVMPQTRQAYIDFFGHTVTDPAYGFTSESLKRIPTIRKIIEKWFPEIMPLIGSKSMRTRGSLSNQLLKGIGPDAYAGRVEGYSRDIAAFLMVSPEYKAVTESARELLETVVKGTAKPGDYVTLQTIVSQVLHQKRTPEYLKAAIKAHEEAVLSKRTTRAAYTSTGRARPERASLEDYRVRLLSSRARKQSAESALAARGKPFYSELPPGAKGMLGAAYLPAWVGVRGAAGVGRGLEGIGKLGRNIRPGFEKIGMDPSGAMLRRLLTGAAISPGLRAKVAEALNVLSEEGFGAYRTKILELLRDPEFAAEIEATGATPGRR